jgi:hypothetical protein
VVAERLVNEAQVVIVEIEPRKGSFERALRLLLALILNPQLGRDEQLIARNAAGFDRVADCLLVEVRASGVERAIASVEASIIACSV